MISINLLIEIQIERDFVYWLLSFSKNGESIPGYYFLRVFPATVQPSWQIGVRLGELKRISKRTILLRILSSFIVTCVERGENWPNGPSVSTFDERATQ